MSSTSYCETSQKKDDSILKPGGSMKKIISGSIFMFFGLFLYLIIHIKAVDMLPTIGSWSEKGRFWEALKESNGLIPTYLGISFCVTAPCSQPNM